MHCIGGAAWNLALFARARGSVIRHLSERLSGVTVPWVYMGMLFASFCWHNEDNYLYSINYMHWGQPKQWYGIPGSNAAAFEAVMRKNLSALFKAEVCVWVVVVVV